MAGLGEACSHISALLFAAEANTQVRKNTSCTSTPCSWVVPSIKKVDYALICKTDFTTPQKRTKTIGNDAASPIASSSVQNQEPTEGELKCLYKKISESKEKPSILSIVPGFCNFYIPIQKVVFYLNL